MRWVGALAAMVSCAATPVSSSAAQAAHLLLGGVHARYGDSLSGTAGMVGIDADLRGAGAVARGSMAVSQFLTGEWAWQASARAMLARPLGGTLAVGLLASGSLNDYEGGQVSGEWLATGVVSHAAHGWSLTGQVGGGAVRQIDANTLGFGTAAAAAGREIVRGITVQGTLGIVAAPTVAYADLGFETAYEHARLSLVGGVGVRMGDIRDDPYGRVRVAYRATQSITVEASAGRYAPDLVGFQEGLYGTLGLRMALTGRDRAIPGARPVVVEPVDDSLVAVTVRYAGPAQQVRMAGSWNGWRPVDMHALGPGRWRAVLPIPAGIHEFSLIVDGERWVVPDDAVTVPDQLGGAVAVLVVSPRS